MENKTYIHTRFFTNIDCISVLTQDKIPRINIYLFVIMSHLSFFWLKAENEKIIKGLESEFCTLVKETVKHNTLSLPPIPEVLAKLHTLCNDEETTVRDVADLLLDDPSLAASIIRTSNTIMFNRRNIICHDLLTAVSRLGIMRVRDIATAQAIDELKNNTHCFEHECNITLSNSAMRSRQLAGTMALICQGFINTSTKPFRLEPEKALLVGLLADIGLFGLINEYQNYLNNGNYLDLDIALCIFQHCCTEASPIVLKHWGFDKDYIEVSSNKKMPYCNEQNTSYLDIARMANHLLLFKNNDDAIEDHYVEMDLTGAEVMYELTNLSDRDFDSELQNVMKSCGL